MQKMSPIFTLLREFTVCIVDNGLIKPYGLDGLFELTQDPCSSALSQQPILCVSDSELMRFLAFFCKQDWRNFHLSVVTVIFIVTSLVMWCPSLFAKISRPQGGIPLSLFLALSLYVAIPFGHWVWMNGGFNNATVLVSKNCTNSILPGLTEFGLAVAAKALTVI